MGNEQPRKCTKKPPNRATVFKQEKVGGITYRIPSLIYIEEDKVLIALAEKRSTPADTDAKMLVVRKGKFLNGSVEWSPLRELRAASLPHHRTMNPCPVYEKETKTLFIFFICVPSTVSEWLQRCEGVNVARLCYVSSKDGGENWSEVTDLTESVIGEIASDWATFAVGPGHGIQLESGKLVIPAYAYFVNCRCFSIPWPPSVNPHAFYFYSTDCGETWLLGEAIQKKSCECEMAEMVTQTDGNYVYCNARNAGGHRVEALGKSNTTKFDEVQLAPALVEQRHGCQGSVVAFPVPASISENRDGETAIALDTQMWLLFSHPTNHKSRKDLGVYLNTSPFRKSDWDEPWVVNKGPSGYSDLTYCADEGLFVCLLECGEKSEFEQIAVMVFSISDVLEAITKA